MTEDTQHLREAFLQVIDTAMHFEYASMPVGRANLSETVAAAMWADIDRIILPRNCFRTLENHQDSTDLCYVVGERGTGKSTALNYVLRKSDAEMIADPTSVTDVDRATKTILHVDGNSLVSRFKANQSRDLLTREVIDEINRKFMVGNASILDLSEFWRLYVTMHAPDFAPFLLRISEDHDFKIESYSDLRFVREYAFELRSEWDTAWTKFNNRASEEKFPIFVDMMAKMGHRLVIHLDNVDPLIDRDRESALDAVTSVVDLAASAKYKVNVTIAARREHYQWLQVSLDYRQHQKVTTSPMITQTDPSQTRGDIQEVYEIFMKRIGVLRDRSVRVAIAKDHSRARSVDLTHVNSYLSELEHGAEWVLKSFFFRQRTSVGTYDLGLSPLFSYWHNGSIRGMARSIHSLVQETVEGPGVSANRPIPGDRAARTVFFRHMLTFGVEDSSQGDFLTPHSSTTILVPREVASQHGPQFFLSLRVLHYLRACDRRSHGAAVSTTTLHRDLMNAIGVEPIDIDRVVAELSERPGYELGLVRVHKSGTDRESVSLLPAGRTLIDRLVLTCESLFWTACAHEVSRTAVAERLGIASGDLPSLYDDESTRASAAMIFVGEYMLPLFKREHRYLDPAHTITDQDVRYLGRYVQAFGFERNDWFLSKLRDRIVGFATTGGPGVRLTQSALTAKAAIQAAEARLNTIAARFPEMS